MNSVIEWLKQCGYDQHGLGSKPTRAILLRPWQRRLGQFPLLGGLAWQAVLNFIHISI